MSIKEIEPEVVEEVVDDVITVKKVDYEKLINESANTKEQLNDLVVRYNKLFKVYATLLDLYLAPEKQK